MNDNWTRRHFLRSAAAAGSCSAWPSSAAYGWMQDQLPPPRSQKDSPEITSGRVVPLLETNVARPLRYTAEEGAFVIRNGSEFFNRPLYGPNIPFRVDGGDKPEFSLYLPGHGGNLRLGVLTHTGASKWLFACASIVTTYTQGRLTYAVQDPLLGTGATLHLECLTQGAGFCVQAVGDQLSPGITLAWAFGGVSGRKGRRNGDIGCEVEPVSQFFQMRPDECRGNMWTLPPETAASSSNPQRSMADVRAGKAHLRVTVSPASAMRVGNAERWNSPWPELWETGQSTASLPVLLGRTSLSAEPSLLMIEVLEGTNLPPTLPQESDPKPVDSASPTSSHRTSVNAFSARKAELAAIAGRLQSRTPDPFLDGMTGALAIAADAIWDEAQGCVMHGAVAWRMPLAGWRGPYALDVTGQHERMRRHLRHWIAQQNVSNILNGSGGRATAHGFGEIAEATGPPDPGSHGSRSEALLHANGDLSHNHYDMNLVFFDALLRHLRWTGDLSFAREAWPALQRHAAWERRLFRREYGSSEQTQPLYEAYAAIWASDNLQYNGGGATHSSAYNLYLNRSMAALAKTLAEAPAVITSYELEADAIARAMRAQLWMRDRGAFAESREWLGERRLAENPAVWTMYQAIDSEVPSDQEAWQMAADRLRALHKVPIVGEGVPADAGWQIGCSDWQPYVWSLTLLVLAENLATALALFQAGMADEGYALLRGSLLDAGYRGLCPGNFPMSLQLDPHRQESQRDFGDPIGCASRALMEGLWGVQPDLLAGSLRLRPQLPLSWQQARFSHPEVQIEFTRRSDVDHWHIASSFSRPVHLRLELRARTTLLPEVRVNGKRVEAHFADEAVGEPRLVLAAPGDGPHWQVEVRWQGEPVARRPEEPLHCTVGTPVQWPFHVGPDDVLDPQQCLQAGVPARVGGHTIFVRQKHGSCTYLLPLELRISEPDPALPDTAIAASAQEQFDPVPLGALLTGQVREILTRGYDQPRSGLCSLGLPSGLLGGWANFDSTASISDAGLRRAGGLLRLANGVTFMTPSSPAEANCCFLSHWSQDVPQIRVPVHGQARALYLLIAATTFPQATGSPHATVKVHYKDAAAATETTLRSPATWWPVEQDYLVDDYLFRLEAADAQPKELPWRIDLLTGNTRLLSRGELRKHSGPIKGGSAFAVRIALQAGRELEAVEIRCELYGVVMGLLGITLGR